MTTEQQALLKQLEEDIDKALQAFESSLSGVNEKLFDSIKEWLGKLKTRNTGEIISSLENLKLVNGFSADLDKIVKESGYAEQVKKYLRSFAATQQTLNSYFSTLAVSFNDNKTLYKEIVRQNIQTTVTSLLGSGIDANFKDPIAKILSQNVAGGSSSKNLRELLKNEIVGNGSLTQPQVARLTRYSKQVTSDSLEQFSRNYIETISSDLGLIHYLYQGTNIKDTREFCKARSGRYFTKEEVQSFASLDWSGKIKGTNASNILTFAGGYACRHRFIPVTPELYERENTKGKAGLR